MADKRGHEGPGQETGQVQQRVGQSRVALAGGRVTVVRIR